MGQIASSRAGGLNRLLLRLEQTVCLGNEGLQLRWDLVRQPPRVADANLLDPGSQDLERPQTHQDLNRRRHNQDRSQEAKGREYIAAKLSIERIERPDFGKIHCNDEQEIGSALAGCRGLENDAPERPVKLLFVRPDERQASNALDGIRNRLGVELSAPERPRPRQNLAIG